MKRLVFAKPVTRRLTPGSNDYTNPTRPSRHLAWPGGQITGGNHLLQLSDQPENPRVVMHTFYLGLMLSLGIDLGYV